MARRLIWWGLSHDHAAIHGFQAGGKLPPLPKPVVLALAPVIARIESRANDVSDEAVQADLAALPGHLDHVDQLIADGVIGGESPNAADRQIATSVRLIMKIADRGPLLGGRPAAELANRLFADQAGEVPAGTFPASWVPQNSSSSAASLAG
jgi:glutathione S-transferase